MAKELLIDPAVVRAATEVELGSIPVNAYRPDLEQERASYGDQALDRIGRDMMLVREFELMLNAIKREGSYLGVSYIHAGPAHLSFADRGVTFATTTRKGVCFTLREPVPGIAPFGLLPHPGVTVTVAEPERLLERAPLR